MIMNDLLKEAIADAKAVRQTAMANAKLALEEAFTPRIQSMLSAKLSEEEGEEDYGDEIQAEDDSFNGDGTPDEGESIEDVEEQSDSSDIGAGDNKVDVADGEDEEDPGEGDLVEGGEVEIEVEPEAPVEEEDDLELEEIIRELEEEMDGEAEEAETEIESEPVAEEGEGEEEIDIQEIIRALREEDDEEYVEESEDGYEGESKELDNLKEEDAEEPELEEAYNVIRFLKSKINEVNLLNAKLLFSNKLFRNYSLNESQKLKVIENFDRAANLREVKLVFATLSESFNFKSKKRIKESYASKVSRSTRPKKILSEGNDLAKRWKHLAFGKR
jgi:hypothetical protein